MHEISRVADTRLPRTGPHHARTRHMAGAFALAFAVGALAIALLPAGSQAATPATDYLKLPFEAPNPQAGGRWAERTAVANDLDGDGVNDYFVAAPMQDTTGPDRGRVYMMSGRTGALRYRINSPQPQDNAKFGFFISTFGDADGDGKTDIAIGTDAQTVGANSRQGKAWVFSGVDGSLLYDLDNPQPQSDGRFGSRIGSAGDVNGDGVKDVIMGASNNDIPAGCAEDGVIEDGCYKNTGQAFVFNGATGALLRTYEIPAADRTAAYGVKCGTTAGPAQPCGSFGIAVQSPGDTNGDGVNDQQVGASSYGGQGRMYVFDGASGALRLRVDSPQPQTGSNWSFQDAAPGAPGDVNGDGRDDLYANGFTQDGPMGPGQGRAWIFNGQTGALIRAIDDPTPTPGGQFGWSVDKVDYNKDGVPDQYIGQSPHHVAGTPQDGGTYVMDGRDGTLLKALELPAGDTIPAENNGARLGWTATVAGDLNGDGEPDFLGGGPFLDVGGIVDQGRLYRFMSNLPVPVPTPGPTAGTPGTPGTPPANGRYPAKLSLARVRIVQRDQTLDVLAPITSRASGRVEVELYAAGRKHRFEAPIDAANGRIRFTKRIPKAQADLGTGIVTIAYAGDADTRPQTVRLRAASRQANLDLGRPKIVDGRLKASGRVASIAHGVVRMQLQYDYKGETRIIRFRAPISGGRWELDEPLSDVVKQGIAGRKGTVHSYTLFTGFFERRVRGEMRSFQVLGEQ